MSLQRIVPSSSVVIVRENRRYIPEIGKAFSATQDEVAALVPGSARLAHSADQPGSLQHLPRVPVPLAIQVQMKALGLPIRQEPPDRASSDDL